jgi:prepilin-type N-terminal cleavage/methylation domain-containing protein
MKNLNHKGFTLVEVLISMIVLAFLSLAVFKMQVSNSWGVAASDKRTEAVQTATYILDSLKILGLHRIDTGSTVQSNCLSGIVSKSTNSLQCSTSVTNRSIDTGFGWGANVTTVVTSKKVDLVVKWFMNGAEHKYQTQAILK